MKAETLKKAILQYAMQGKLVEQDPNDEPASVLLERIKAEKEQLIKDGKIKKEKHLPPITEDELPYELPQGWEWVRLGEIGDWGSGSTPNKARFDYYRNGTINWLKTGDLNDGYINEIPEKITELALKETSVKIKPVGSLLIAMYGATIGKLGILNIPATTNQACCACIKFADINTKYLFYYLLSERDNLRKRGEGGAQPNISREKIIVYPLPLPPLAEQQRIVDKLEQILPFVEEYGKNEEKLSKLNSTLPDKIKQSILQYAVQGKLVPQDPDDEPASVLLERIKTEKEQLIKDGKIKKEKKLSPITEEEIPYELPQGWEWVRFAKVFDVRDGTHDSPKNVPNGIPLITSKDFNNGEIDFSNAKLISREDHDKIQQRSYVEDDDILYSMIGGNIGNMVLVKKDREFSIKNVALFKYYSKELSNPQFLKLLLSAITIDFKNKAFGGAQQFVSLTFIRNYVIALPPLAEQHRIVTKVEELMKIVDSLKV